MAVIAPFVFWQVFDNNGNPLSNGTIESYEAGTATPKDTFADADETALNPNPIVLDGNGRANIWLDSGAYKFVLKDSSGTTVSTVDDFLGDATGGIATYMVSSNLNLDSTYENSLIIGDGSFTINLLAAASAGDGFQFRVKNSGTGTITIDPNGSETIDGSSTLSINPNGYFEIFCDGSNWFSGGADVSLSSDNTFTGDNTFEGALRLSNDNPLVGRNSSDSADIEVIQVNTSDVVELPNGASANSNKITNVLDPTNDQDAATKNYVDLSFSSAQISAATGTTLIPSDNTSPLITEGTEVVSASITPKNSSNVVRVQASFVMSNNGGRIDTAAVFRGSTCIGVVVQSDSVANRSGTLSVNIVDSPTTTSATTYSIRVGLDLSGTWYVSQLSGATYNGEPAKNRLTLEEKRG